MKRRKEPRRVLSGILVSSEESEAVLVAPKKERKTLNGLSTQNCEFLILCLTRDLLLTSSIAMRLTQRNKSNKFWTSIQSHQVKKRTPPTRFHPGLAQARSRRHNRCRTI